mgnify:FL=1
MKKMNLKLFVLAMMGSFMVMGCSISPNNFENKYQAYVIYRQAGGELSYFEWVKAGSPKEPRVKPGKKDNTIKSTRIDERGHLIIEFNDGTILDAGEFECKHLPVNFFCGKELLKVVNVKMGEKVEEPTFATLKIKGWFLDEELTKKWDFANQCVTCATSLYADYAASNIHLNFVDTTLNIPLEPQTVTFGEKYELPEPIDYASKHRFLGWYYNGKKIDNEGIWNIPDHASLLAKWEAKEDFDFNYFGLYPQTAVVDQALAEKIEEKGKKVYANRERVNYYEYGGFRYRKLRWGKAYASYDKPHYFHDGKTKVIANKDYFFKLEPLRWKKIKISDSEAICLTEKVINTHYCSWNLDDRTINGKTVSPNEYEHSYYRAWLNSMKTDYSGDYGFGNGFKDSDLFLNEEEEAILQPHTPYNDKFFFLSKEECEKYLPKEEDRIAAITDFVITYRELPPEEKVQWATRSSGNEKTKVILVNSDGTYGEWLSHTYNGVRPAIKVKLK